MPNTDALTELVQAIVTEMEELQATLALDDQNPLQIQDVWFGDQSAIPRFPAVCVEPGDTNRELQGASHRTLNTMSVYILVYHGQMTDMATKKLECNQLAEAIVDKLHAELTLGGLVIHGFCPSSESGYATRGTATIFAHRITWQGISKTTIGAVA